jgi:glucokinase
VNCHATAEEILAVWTNSINEMQSNYPSRFKKVGIAMPGPFDYERGISFINGVDKYELLYGVNIKEALALRTGIENKNITFKNDADAFIEGEVFGGAARGFQKVVGLTLGTGLGSCYCINGSAFNAGLHDMHYRDSVWEDYISTRWFEKTYFALTGKKVNGVKPIADLYEEEQAAREIFTEFAVNLTALIRHCIELYHPEAIVLGGNIANALPLFKNAVNEQLCGDEPVLIVQAALGEQAALIGAVSSFGKISFASINGGLQDGIGW